MERYLCYAFAENDVIRSIDLEGAEKKIVIIPYDHTKPSKVITSKAIIKAQYNSNLANNGIYVLSAKGGRKQYLNNGNGPPASGTLFGYRQESGEMRYEFKNSMDDVKRETQARNKQEWDETTDMVFRVPGESFQKTGDACFVVGMGGAPFTEGGTLPLAVGGDIVSKIGMGAEITADLLQGKYPDAGEKGAILLVSFGASTVGGKLMGKGLKTAAPWVNKYGKSLIEKNVFIGEKTYEYVKSRNQKKDNGNDK